MHSFKPLLSLFLGFVILFGSTMAYALSPQNTPAAPDTYTKIPGQWQVTSAYGPRDPGKSGGSTFHKGIDYSQNIASDDKGVVLTSRENGTIGKIETGILKPQAKYISIFGGLHLTYLHIFDDTSLPITLNNANVTAAGYTKVVLDNVQNNTKKGKCGAIYFYKMNNDKEWIDKGTSIN